MIQLQIKLLKLKKEMKELKTSPDNYRGKRYSKVKY